MTRTEPDNPQGPVDLTAEQRTALRKTLCAAYWSSLKDPELRDPDPVVAAMALLRVRDARLAYNDAGGRAGSPYSGHYVPYYEAAEAVVDAAKG